MMAPSKAQNDLDAVAKKLDATFPLPSDCQVDDNTSTKSKPKSKRRSCELLREEFNDRRDKFMYPGGQRFISSTFPFSQKIRKCKFLEDDQLFDAIMFSKIVKDEIEYQTHRSEYDGQLVWLEVFPDPLFSLRYMMLIFQNRMIYQIDGNGFDEIRRDFQKSCEFFKKQPQNDLDAFLKTFDTVLTIPNKRVAVDGATEKSSSEFSSSAEFLEYLEETRKVYVDEINKNPEKFQHTEKYLSSSFLSYSCIKKSKILEEQKLLDAILFSKIFRDEADYARSRDEYRGQMVWVEMSLPSENGPSGFDNDIALICENKIIYETDRENIDSIREQFKKHWLFFENHLRKNLDKALGVQVSVPEPSEYVSDLQSSVGAAVSSNALSQQHQKLATVTEETKKILLDELSSLNLDPRLRQQFEFDLKLLADKDVYYWRDRLDALRCLSNSAPVGSAQSPESEQLRQKVAELEEMTASLRDGHHVASNLSERLSKVEELVGQNQLGQSTSTDMSSKEHNDADLLMHLCNEALKKRIVPDVIIEGWIRCVGRTDNAEELRDMASILSTWLKTEE